VVLLHYSTRYLAGGLFPMDALTGEAHAGGSAEPATQSLVR
jgi:hypothetical protein